ncbi:HTH domain-containing protein [Pyrococcus abyssi]|uniref:HTH domain-containing protein n=1 Tax=Pyrococcus abyssi TaxID=29292 RepID=UPI002F403E0A
MANLSDRTVRYALKILKERGFIKEIVLLGDARKRVYALSSKNVEDVINGGLFKFPLEFDAKL